MKTKVWCYAGQRRASITAEFPRVPKGIHQRLTEFIVVECHEKDCPHRNGKNPDNHGECLLNKKIDNPWI